MFICSFVRIEREPLDISSLESWMDQLRKISTAYVCEIFLETPHL